MARSPTELSADYPVDRPFTVELELPVLWNDMDALGHVNNTIYFRYFESVRIAYFQRISLEAGGPAAAGANGELPEITPLLASTTCDFLVPLVFPDKVTIGARIVNIGNTSFTMHYRILSHQHGGIAARGAGTVVVVSRATSKPTPIPYPLRQAIQRLENGQEGVGGESDLRFEYGRDN